MFLSWKFHVHASKRLNDNISVNFYRIQVKIHFSVLIVRFERAKRHRYASMKNCSHNVFYSFRSVFVMCFHEMTLCRILIATNKCMLKQYNKWFQYSGLKFYFLFFVVSTMNYFVFGWFHLKMLKIDFKGERNWDWQWNVGNENRIYRFTLFKWWWSFEIGQMSQIFFFSSDDRFRRESMLSLKMSHLVSIDKLSETSS